MGLQDCRIITVINVYTTQDPNSDGRTDTIQCSTFIQYTSTVYKLKSKATIKLENDTVIYQHNK